MAPQARPPPTPPLSYSDSSSQAVEETLALDLDTVSIARDEEPAIFSHDPTNPFRIEMDDSSFNFDLFGEQDIWNIPKPDDVKWQHDIELSNGSFFNPPYLDRYAESNGTPSSGSATDYSEPREGMGHHGPEMDEVWKDKHGTLSEADETSKVDATLTAKYAESGSSGLKQATLEAIGDPGMARSNQKAAQGATNELLADERMSLVANRKTIQDDAVPATENMHDEIDAPEINIPPDTDVETRAREALTAASALFCTRPFDTCLQTYSYEEVIGIEARVVSLLNTLQKDFIAEFGKSCEVSSLFSATAPETHEFAVLMVNSKPFTPSEVRESSAIYELSIKILANHAAISGSKAMAKLDLSWLELAHESCTKRLLAAVQGQAVVVDGNILSEGLMRQYMAELVSAPPAVVRVEVPTRVSCADVIKGCIEDAMGEEWDWWPLAPRQHALRFGYSRLFWCTPLLAALSDIPSFFRGHGHGSSAQNADTVGFSSSVTSKTGISKAASDPFQSQPGPVQGDDGVVRPRAANTIHASLKHDLVTSHRVYLCVNRGDGHKIPEIPLTPDTMDMDFFTDLKDQYLRARGRLRRVFSMWRFSHCEFYELRKHPFGTGEPAQIDYPKVSNDDYDFDPRPIDPCPPLGPILKCEFRHYFENPYLATQYRPCSWRLWQRDRLLGNLTERKAIDLLPKKKQEVKFDDGERLQFWGLYAVERRAFAWLAVYGFLLNLPGIVFFFLWLFAWRHESDLQNASVPITISLTLSVTFLALVYESREGKRL
ncbi:hypothetical protein HII31_03466 [Pseudocercospora fuligena]|uniref:Uncharacterized protein n=1 Tax=Pseudocercospora fuligena TaxID=685502 RepID=A0A8H6VQJ5_9PEZI|nr:hypothetical protein HII31_03466 [Pseudocercospora fuligena]